MKLSELIAKYGDDRAKFQNLDNSIDRVDYSSKKGTKITFGTDAPLNKTMDGMEQIGIVVWLDRNRVAEILEGEK